MIAEHHHLQPLARRFLTIVLALMLIGGVAVLIWMLWVKPTLDKRRINSFETCVSAGNQVLDSYPAVCLTKDGRRFNGPGPNLKGSNTLYNEQRGEQPDWQ